MALAVEKMENSRYSTTPNTSRKEKTTRSNRLDDLSIFSLLLYELKENIELRRKRLGRVHAGIERQQP